MVSASSTQFHKLVAEELENLEKIGFKELEKTLTLIRLITTFIFRLISHRRKDVTVLQM